MKLLITTVPFADNDKRPLELLASSGVDYFINPLNRKLTEQELVCAQLKVKVEKLVADIQEIDTKIDSIPAEIINIIQVRRCIQSKTINLATTQKRLTKDKKELKDK